MKGLRGKTIHLNGEAGAGSGTVTICVVKAWSVSHTLNGSANNMQWSKGQKARISFSKALCFSQDETQAMGVRSDV